MSPCLAAKLMKKVYKKGVYNEHNTRIYILSWGKKKNISFSITFVYEDSINHSSLLWRQIMLFLRYVSKAVDFHESFVSNSQIQPIYKSA